MATPPKLKRDGDVCLRLGVEPVAYEKAVRAAALPGNLRREHRAAGKRSGKKMIYDSVTFSPRLQDRSRGEMSSWDGVSVQNAISSLIVTRGNCQKRTRA